MNNKLITVMQHQYAIGDKVHVTIDGAKGEIAALMPYTFVAPAYDVRIGGMIVAVSERSIAKIESQDTDHIHNAISEPHSDARDHIDGLSGPNG